MRKQRWLKILIGIGVICLAVFVGWSVAKNQEKATTIIPIHDSASAYKFINPTLYIETPESLSFPKYSPLKNALQASIAAAEENQQASAIGLYYKDLDSGDWIGINQTQQFDPASMMKVVTLIALLRAAETQPQLLLANITVPKNITIPATGTQDYYPPADPVSNGNTYTVSYLIQRLIMQSDNGADVILIDYLGSPAMATVYKDLNLPAPGTSVGISPQNYSHLFRALYNATYLSSPDSESALQLLSQTNFTAGIVAGVPADTIVSHKFGESLDAPNAPGLNDCGIVYYPNHPYFLCIMTKGTDFNTLAGVIKNISSVAWQQTDLLAGSK
jgi:beta-lactamase class A